MTSGARIRRPARLLWVTSVVGMVAGVVALSVLAGVTPSSTSGYLAQVVNSANTAALAPYFTCNNAEGADEGTAYFQWYVNEASGSTTAADSSGSLLGAAAGAYRGTMTTSTATPLACSRDTAGAYVLNGTSSYVSNGLLFLAAAGPSNFTEEVWFKTSVVGGRLIGFGNVQAGASSASNSDRMLYINTSGKLVFGVNATSHTVITSPATVTDGLWHHAAASLNSSGGATGMKLYLDGVLVATGAYTAPTTTLLGYWHVGWDTLTGWPLAPTAARFYFSGQMRFAAAYSSVLTDTQIKNHWAAGQ